MTINDDFDDILSGLNDAQMEAASTTEGFIRVIAGAGSGKTRALTHRFAYLVNELGILPGHILCVTFTNKSANEMRQRIHLLTGDNDTGYISTFHGFCVNILQEDSHAVQYPKSFLVLDNSDINDMLKIIYEERGLSLRDMTFSKARDMIEIRKIKTDPKYYRDMITIDLSVLREKYLRATDPMDIIFYGYLYQEKKAFALDYNDLIKFSLYIFETNADICLKWQKRLEYIMIDEFQDIDPLQYRLMEVLCAYHKNLFVVGDPDQTIYTWRGANVKYLMEFDQVFPGTKTILMMQNYRSTPQILAAVNSLIAKNEYRIKKDLIPVLSDGDKPLSHHGKNTVAEAEWIGKKIKELNERQDVPLKDITVLYRAHYVTRPLEEYFMREKIPYTIYSGVQFFDRMEIKDALSYLRMIAFQDDLSFRRVVNTPKRNIGQRRMAFLEAYAEKNQTTLYAAMKETLEQEIFRGTGASAFVEMIEHFTSISGSFPVTDLLSMILNASGYEKALRTEGSQERLDNLAELKQSIYEYEISCGEEAALPDYLRHVALYTNQDVQQTGDKVKLMTVHASKGLEFPNVFLCGLNEGVFPSGKVKDQNGMEEERRLAFVALTRAEKRLFLTEAMGRNFDGSPRYPSRFMLDIDDSLLTHTAPPDERLIREARSYIRIQTNAAADVKDEFAPGQRIRHKVFGEGEILKLDAEAQAYVIHFDRLGTEREVSFRAKLEKITGQS